MKAVIAIGCLVLAAVVYATPTDKYTDRFDGINLDDIISNKKLLENYILCCLDKGKCTAEGKELKSHIGDALETKCAKCTDVQRAGANKMISHIINNEPGYWKELTAKYDPTGKHSKEYEKELTIAKKQ